MMRIERSGSASRMVGVGLETKKGDCGAPNGDGLQRRESLVSGDGNVLGGATGGDVTVQGAEPRCQALSHHAQKLGAADP